MSQSVLDGQTLGSFLVHRAWKLGDSPATMAHRIGLGWSIWTRDLDRSVGLDAIKKISLAAKLTCAEVELMTLMHLLNCAGVPTQRNGFQRWLTPVGLYHRKRLRYGQLYCPECLLTGRNYLSMGWRLGSNWVCIIHSRLLRDSCPNCDMPFAPYRHDALMIGRCDRCATPLHSGSLESAPKAEHLLQLRLRSLWESALIGQSAPLAAFHDALTTAATRNSAFRRAGEPWIYWRIAERRKLLVKVSATALISPLTHIASRFGAADKITHESSRRCCRGLPADPAARAETLLRMAARVKYPRLAKARISKSA